MKTLYQVPRVGKRKSFLHTGIKGTGVKQGRLSFLLKPGSRSYSADSNAFFLT